jgi:cyanophycinase
MKNSPRVVVATAAAVACVLALSAAADESKGHLLIIGGGREPAGMLERFITLAGGTNNAKIIVLPMASEDAVGTGAEMVTEFKALGVTQIESVVLSRVEALNPESATRLNGATGVFFTGGDQSRLAAVLVHSPIQQTLKNLYRQGAVLAGTSAGAAIMSEVMITGEELLNHDKANAFRSIRQNNIETTAGLGFVTNAIIDQHFIQRKRYNRLFSVVLEHPNLVGIGIDESTAVLMNPDQTFEVLGESAVMVMDARSASNVRADQNGHLSVVDTRVHLLLAGDGFDLKSGSCVPKR